MALKFFGYVEAPGEEFNLPGVLTSPLFGENCLYPIWVDSYENLYWLSVKDGEMYVCPVAREFDEWEFDSDSATWIGRHGELRSDPVDEVYDVAFATDLVEGWVEVKLRSELGEKMNLVGV
jgi:hypothetical protein